MKRLKSILLTACAVVLGVTLLPVQQASAATSAALSITPKKSYTVEPGKSVKDTLVIRNLDEAEKLDLTLRVVDFTYTDEGGTPKLMLAEDAPQTTWSLKPFLTVPKTVSVAPKQSTTIDMNVAIPANHGAGSYYSAIVYSSGTPEEGNVGLSASGVTLAFVNIPGEVKEELKLEKFGAYLPVEGKKPASYVYFTAENPKNVAYTLKNNGNVTEAPVGSITVKPLFGKERVIQDVNPSQSLALIGQTRTYAACFKLESSEVEFQGSRTQSSACANSDLWPGFYKLDLNLFYGQNGNRTQDIQSSSWFIYFPVWAIIVLILALIVIGFFGYRAYSSARNKFGKSKKLSHRK
ncbi:hypothetical protein I8H83_03200 [Candidatus Saccharibacteria bacterium]|nr:hypothetical protein [Candidatus Saccharibacteria bacterium]